MRLPVFAHPKNERVATELVDQNWLHTLEHNPSWRFFRMIEGDDAEHRKENKPNEKPPRPVRFNLLSRVVVSLKW